MSLFDDIFVDLRVLSKVPKDGKIITTGNGRIQIEDMTALGGWLAKGRRTLSGDSRDETVKILMKLINNIVEISDTVIQSLQLQQPTGEHSSAPAMPALNDNARKCHQLAKLCIWIRNAKPGIINLLETTYCDDVNTTAKLDEIIDKMDQQLARITDVLDFVKVMHTNQLNQLTAGGPRNPVTTPPNAPPQQRRERPQSARTNSRSPISDDSDDLLNNQEIF